MFVMAFWVKINENVNTTKWKMRQRVRSEAGGEREGDAHANVVER